MSNLYDALAAAIYVSRQTLAGAVIDSDDKRIRASGLYEEWLEGDIKPDNPAWFTFWRPLHGTSPETARPFVPVQGAHDMYRVGEYMIYTDGKTYQCKQDTNFSPEDYAQAWEVYDG